MAVLARDVMQTHVVTVEPELPLFDAYRLFVEEEITGAPVVDETDRLVGVISSSDLLRAVDEEHQSASSEPHYFREWLEFSGPDWASAPPDFQDRLAELTVADAMTRGGVTVGPDAPIAEVAALMRHHRIHRVLVLENDLLVGIVSTFDLIALLEKESGSRS
jgi:CBS domain-containing protein